MKDDDMLDKNINYNKYFLKLVSEFDEATMLNPDIAGNEKSKLNKNEFKIEKDNICEFCEKNLISENILFLASACIALNKFNFSNKNLIFHENNTIFATIFEDRSITINNYLEKINENYQENLKYINFPADDVINEYDLKTEFYYSFNKDLDLNSFQHKYNFYLSIKETDSDFILCSFYNDQLYSEKYIMSFLKSIITIINQFLSSDISKLTLSDIFLVEESEKIEFNEVETPFIHKRFEEQVEENPDRIALISNGEKLTYEELNENANRVANALIKKGVEPKSNVLVMLPRTSDLISSILGILKTGSAFIPIDPEYPQDRIDYIYENSQADYIVSDEASETTLNIKDLLKYENTENPNVIMDSSDIAYMIYTSGSTGNPKGIMTSHMGTV